jgi:hypothetical protein
VSGFQPSAIPRYAVIRAVLPVASDPEEKLLVVVSHQADHVLVMKATSQVALYLNDPEQMAGCVFYRARETCFHVDTVIQPDNLFLIQHARLRDPACVIGHLPSDFHGKLVQAIRDSIKLNENRRRHLLEMLGER